MTVFDKIKELKQINTISKHEQLVNGIINAIDSKVLVKGDQLPSINHMVATVGYARKTIVKAYEELKDRGIVESKNFIGYFIASEETLSKLKVALLLYSFHSFQEVFYNTFRTRLGKNVQLDVFFHHNNPEIFKAIISNIFNKYGMYVVAPIEDKSTEALLRQIPSEKLLLVDRYLPLGKPYSYISQEFEKATYQVLLELLPEIKNYKEICLIFKRNTDHPEGILRAFERFVKRHNLKGKVLEEYKPGTAEKQTVYFFIGDSELWELLRDCKKNKYEVGRDVGVLSHNDSTVKEIICGGITTCSANFEAMADEAVGFVQNKTPIQKIVPIKLIRRNSL